MTRPRVWAEVKKMKRKIVKKCEKIARSAYFISTYPIKLYRLYRLKKSLENHQKQMERAFGEKDE